VGSLSCNAAGWFVGGTRVAFGDSAWLASSALGNWDGDGAVESNFDELRGLVIAKTTVTAGLDDSGRVWTLGGEFYLPAPATPSASPSPSHSPSQSPSKGASSRPSASPTE
jgi:hypothetical protein